MPGSVDEIFEVGDGAAGGGAIDEEDSESVVSEVGLCESDGDFVEGGAVDIGERVPDVSVRIAVAESPSVKVKA